MSHINSGLQFQPSSIYQLPSGFTEGKVFFDTSVYIDTPSFRATNMNGLFNEESRKAFYAEAQDFFKANGFTQREPESQYFDKGQHEYVYVHPDNLSGFLSRESVTALHQAVEQHEGRFSLRWTDVRNVKELITPEELSVRVALSKPGIKAVLIKMLTASRKNYFFDLQRCDSVLSEYARYNDGFSLITTPETQAVMKEALLDILREMLHRDGTLKAVSHDGQLLYRATMKSELAQPKVARTTADLGQSSMF